MAKSRGEKSQIPFHLIRATPLTLPSRRLSAGFNYPDWRIAAIR